jgi:hypothetical protein
MRRRQAYLSFWNILLPHNARRSAQHRTNILQNDESSFERPIWQNVLSYVDDIVMASKKKTTYVSGLAKTFANMREARLKLNLEKCIFGVTRGNVLGCLVSMKCIKANLDKIRAIIQMQPPQNRKEI